MRRTHNLLLVLLTITLMAAISASAAFVSTPSGSVDLTTFSTLVDLNSPAGANIVSSSTPFEIFNSGGQTVNFSLPNYVSTNAAITYGITFNLAGGPSPFDPYILAQGDNSDYLNNNLNQMRFTLGNAVAAIGIHISSLVTSSFFPGAIQSPVELVVFFSDSTSTTTTITATAASGLDPALGQFHGYSSGTNNIVGFQVRGAPIALENLRFGSLSGGGDPDPDPDPDPSPIPEASTFLLCGGALGLLGMLRRRMARA